MCDVQFQIGLDTGRRLNTVNLLSRACMHTYTHPHTRIPCLRAHISVLQWIHYFQTIYSFQSIYQPEYMLWVFPAVSRFTTDYIFYRNTVNTQAYILLEKEQ